MYTILYLDFCGGTPRIEFQYSQKINVPFIVLKRVLKWSILTSIEMQPRNMSDYVAPPQTIFGSTLGWIFLRDRNKIGSIDFQFTVNLLSIYFQLIFNWFQLIFNWFQLISTYFQWIFNWFQFTINWFQFTFNWFSIDVNLLAIDLQLISTWSEISLNWISTCFQLTSHSNPIEIS